MMHAIRIHGYGGPEVMELEALATPIPGIGQAVIRVHAASVNFLDVQKRRGELAGQSFYHRGSPAGSDLPATLGSQGVGMVEARDFCFSPAPTGCLTARSILITLSYSWNG